MRCPCCDNNEWKNIDHVRLKPMGMAMCQKCGFVSYPKMYKTEEQIKEHYRKSYRPAPNVSNMFTGERKLNYHAAFLKPLFESWRQQNIPDPIIGEIGSAMGLFLNWIKKEFPEAEVHGTELTTTYRRVAKHEFGLDLKEELDLTKKYDLICSYHVLEHQMDPDIWLRRYRDALEDSGMIYLSTPIWFREAVNSGMAGFDIEYYWAPDHINAWGEMHLEYIIAKCGLEIVFKNDDIYGNTYLLKKADPKAPPIECDIKTFEDCVERQFQLWKHLQENQTALAIETYKNCPTAWIQHYELHRAEFDKQPWSERKKFLDDCIKFCPHTSESMRFAGDIATRYEKYDDAIKYLSESLGKKPNCPVTLFSLSNAYRQKAMKTVVIARVKELAVEMGDEKALEFVRRENAEREARKEPFDMRGNEEALKLLHEAMAIMNHIRATSTDMANQAISWIYHDQSLMPVEGEV